MDLILRDGGKFAPKGKPIVLQLRDHGPAETQYFTIAYLSLEIARMVADAGAPYWLHGDPQEGKDRRPSDTEIAPDGKPWGRRAYCWVDLVKHYRSYADMVMD